MPYDFGALLGVLAGTPSPDSARSLPRILRDLIAITTVIAHVVGAAIVVVLVVVVLPLPHEVRGDGALLARNVVAAGLYLALAVLIGLVAGLRIARPLLDWLAGERAATETERAGVLRLPLQVFSVAIALWAGAVAAFFLTNLSRSTVFAVEVAIVVALGGLATGSISYLLTQRLARTATARALLTAPPRRGEVPGVALRALFIWALGTTVPVAGTIILAAFALATPISVRELAIATTVLAATALVVGFGSTLIFSRSIADPLERLRDALEQVERGQLDVEVPVYDATEVGFAQAGFNRMVAGLRERERLRDLFGRHVGVDVARRALDEGVRLGGEEREAAALFVDIIGSTAMAIQRSPADVVAVLNAFFGIVVEETQAHGGLVNKFEGDAALCIFGAPLALDGAATAALAAARSMRARMRLELPAVEAGIGVSMGSVVAGNVGAADRYEYTVIGDPVNEAARLTELAKDRPERLVASQVVVARADTGEAARWVLREEVVLRGRATPTRLATPIED